MHRQLKVAAPFFVALAAIQLGAWSERNLRASDQHGDALPQGAVARLGTLRWRHDPGPLRLAYDPKGQKLAALSERGVIRVSEAPSGKELYRLRTADKGNRGGYVGLAKPLAFSPDGMSLAWGTWENSIWLCDAATGKAERKLADHDGLFSFAFSPKSDVVVSSGSDGTIRFWEAATGKEVSRLTLAKGDGAASLAWSPDGKTLAAGCWRGVVRIWGTGSSKLVHELFLEEEKWRGMPVWAVAYGLQGKVLAATGPQGEVHLFDTSSGKKLRSMKGVYQPGGSSIDCLSFSADGKLVAHSRLDCGGLCVWDVATGKEIFKHALAHRDPFSVSCVAFSPDGKTLASSGQDRMIRHWDAATGKPAAQPTGYTAPLVIAYLADGKLLVSDGKPNLVDPTSGKDLRRIDGAFRCLSSDGKTLAVTPSGWSERKVHLHDLATAKQLIELHLPGNAPAHGGTPATALSADGKTLALAQVTGDGYFTPFKHRVSFIEAATGKETGTLPETDGRPHALLYSGNGHALLSVAANDSRRGGPGPTRVHAWEVATGKNLAPPQGDTTGLSARAVAVSPNGKLLAYGATIRRLAGGAEMLKLPADAQPTCVAFSPDGRLLAAGSADGGLRLWELPTGKAVLSFQSADVPITSVAFSPDGRHLTCGFDDSTGLVWDLIAKTLGPSLRKEAGPEELKKLWHDLADADAAAAFRAGCMLSAAPQQAVPFLQEHVHPIPAADPRRLAQFITDLASARFETREAATRALEKLGRETETALRRALKDNPELEVRRRIDQLLAKLVGQPLSSLEVRVLRSVAILERVGTSEARRSLEALSERDFTSELSAEVRGALTRLTSRLRR